MSLYKRVYNDKQIFLLYMKCILYETIYNDNIYLSLCINNKHFFVHENVFLLYETMYNENKYFCYSRKRYRHTRRYVNRNICVIHESVYRVIRDDV